MLEPLEAYFSILKRWNARMNLTALPLENPTDETLDRLGKRLEGGAVVEDVPSFARGIARLVLLEHWRRRHNVDESLA
jgi:hypothetical protein